MNCTQRIRSILNHEIPDRVPIYLMGFPEYGDFFQEFLSSYQKLFEKWTDDEKNIIITPFGDFTTQYFFGHEMIVKGTDIDVDFFKWINEKGEFIEEPAPNVEPKLKVTYWGRLNGVKTLKNGYKYEWYLDGYLKKKEDLLAWFDRYGWPHEHKVKPFNLNAYNEFKANWGDKLYAALGIGGSGLYEKTWFMMGQDRFGYYARKDPEFLMKIINSIKQMNLNIIKELKQAKPELMYCSDDLGQKGRPLISPEMHKKFFFEARKEMYSAVHEIGAKIVMHCCGNALELMPQLVEAGLDGWQSMEPASEIDFNYLKERFGDKLLLIGGIDTSRELCWGTKESVKAHVKNQIEILGKNGGYIAGPAHDFLNQKVELVLAMRDAIYEFGKYKK